MAVGPTLWLLVVLFKGCFGNNTTSSFQGSFLSSSLAHGSPSSQPVPSTLKSSPHLNSAHSTLSPSQFPLNQGASQEHNESTFENKPTVIPPFGTNISVTKSALLTDAYIDGSTSVRVRAINKTNTVASGTSVKIMSSIISHVSTRTLLSDQESSSVQFSSNLIVPQGSNKIFMAEIRLSNMTFSSELQNKSSPLYQKTVLTITRSIDYVMAQEKYYKGCKVIEIRMKSGEVKLELTMGPGSNSDPKISLDRLKNAVERGIVGNLTVDRSFFTRWLKEDPSSHESLLSGQLAGVALILFLLVVLLLIICLGNFADQPIFNERELFTEEVSMENVGTDRGNQRSEDEEWKFDPLFAWSPRKSFDSKL